MSGSQKRGLLVTVPGLGFHKEYFIRGGWSRMLKVADLTLYPKP